MTTTTPLCWIVQREEAVRLLEKEKVSIFTCLLSKGYMDSGFAFHCHNTFYT